MHGSNGEQPEAIENLTDKLVLCATLFALLAALINFTETPEMAYDGAPIAFLLAILSLMLYWYTTRWEGRFE